MTNEVTERQSLSAELQEKVLLGGDLSKLTPTERLSYYNNVCVSLDLNPLTQPFAYIVLNGKLTLYAKKDCTEQLRTKKSISVTIAAREVVEGVYVVTAKATDRTGRCDESIGAVPIKGLVGNDLANAYMKAETKAKRRVTLSICGLGMLDETEIDTIKGARVLAEAVTTGAQPNIPQVRPRSGNHDFGNEARQTDNGQQGQTAQDSGPPVNPDKELDASAPYTVPSGKWKGATMDTVDEGYLLWSVDSHPNTEFRQHCQSELEKRAKEQG